MKKFLIPCILFFLLFSCESRDKENDLNNILNVYIESYPIGIKDYYYTVRFYKKNNDTIIEISQDRLNKLYPIDFSLYPVSDSLISPYRINKEIIYQGQLSFKKELICIYDTDNYLGKGFYNEKVLKKSKNEIINYKEFEYPFLPIKRQFIIKNNHISFLKETDTINFK